MPERDSIEWAAVALDPAAFDDPGFAVGSTLWKHCERRREQARAMAQRAITAFMWAEAEYAALFRIRARAVESGEKPMSEPSVETAEEIADLKDEIRLLNEQVEFRDQRIEARDAKIAELEAQLAEQDACKATIRRVWRALGIETYEQAGGKEISELVAERCAQLDEARAAELEAAADAYPAASNDMDLINYPHSEPADWLRDRAGKIRESK